MDDIYGDFDPLMPFAQVKLALEKQFAKLEKPSAEKVCRYMMNDEKTRIFSADIMVMGRWFENNDARRIGEDVIDVGGEKIRVSTVCLGIDHAWRSGPPKIFETMVFGGDFNESQWRYSTLAQAHRGHKAVVECLKKGIEPEIPEIIEPFFDLYFDKFYPNTRKEE